MEGSMRVTLMLMLNLLMWVPVPEQIHIQGYFNKLLDVPFK